MSRSENRHHRQRVIRNRVRKIKVKWRSSAKGDPAWVQSTARGKDNPFTRCSCEMCQESEYHQAENRRDRKAAKQSTKNETD